MPRADMAKAVEHTEIGEHAAADDDLFKQGGRNVGKRILRLRGCCRQAKR